VRDNRLLRTEPATNNVTDYGVNKDVENLAKLRARTSTIIDRYHDAQQDILESFVDRGQLRKLAEPTRLANGKRVPSLKLDHARQMAVMHALVRFANIGDPRSRPKMSTSLRWTHWDAIRQSIRLPRSATICRSYAPKGWWKRCHTRDDTGW